MTAGLTESQEDYLEVILQIVSEKGAARVKDVAESLKVANASVNRAVKNLSEKGFIRHEPYDLISLTQKGKDWAQNVIHRHEALKNFLSQILLVDESQAEFSACKMEHAISSDIMERMIFLTEFLGKSSPCRQKWLEDFREFVRQAAEKREKS